MGIKVGWLDKIIGEIEAKKDHHNLICEAHYQEMDRGVTARD